MNIKDLPPPLPAPAPSNGRGSTTRNSILAVVLALSAIPLVLVGLLLMALGGLTGEGGSFGFAFMIVSIGVILVLGFAAKSLFDARAKRPSHTPQASPALPPPVPGVGQIPTTPVTKRNTPGRLAGVVVLTLIAAFIAPFAFIGGSSCSMSPKDP